MDTLTFIAKLVEFTAWPVASVALVVLLRREIRALLPYIRRIKAGPVEAEFEKEVQEVHARVSDQLATKPQKDNEVPKRKLLLELAEIHPRSAILEAWLGVETAAVAALDRNAKRSGGPGAITGRTAGAALTQALRKSQVLPEGQLSLFQELRVLRNEVVHTEGLVPTQDSVLRYIDTAAYLQWCLDEAAKS